MIQRWVGLIEPDWESLREFILQNKLPSLIIFFGVSLRVIFWKALYPIWKHFATFVVFELPLLQYVGNFEGYKPSRSPFYDVFSAILYIPTDPILGIRAVTVFSLLVSVLSVPAMFIVARRLFDYRVAVFSTIFYAFYPKLLVLTGQGFPEAAGTGILVLSLFALIDRSGSIRGTVSAGIGVTLAYLTYIPAVLFGIYTGLFLIGQQVFSDGLNLNGIRERFRSIIAYTIFPFAVGTLYILFGPVQKVFETASGGGGVGGSYAGIFVNPSTYSPAEKTIRYIGYHFFDFWWHMRGFDGESGVLRIIQQTGNFLGHWSAVFFLGWGVITVILSIVIVVGFIRMVNCRTRASVYIAGILVLYIAVDTYRNLGWAGGLQVRHILPIILPVSLCFGMGASYLSEYFISVRNIEYQFPNRYLPNFISIQSLFQIITIFLLVTLISASSVNVYYAAQNNQKAMMEPTDRLTSEVKPEEQVAVATHSNYHRTVLYSEGKIMPNIWAENEFKKNYASSRTVVADIRVVSPTNVSNAPEDYLFITEQCGSFSKRERRLIDAAVNAGGSVVFNETSERGSRCSIQNTLISL